MRPTATLKELQKHVTKPENCLHATKYNTLMYSAHVCYTVAVSHEKY